MDAAARDGLPHLVPPAPRFRAMQLLRFCLRGSSGNSELGWELGFGTHFWDGNWDSFLQTCAEILQLCTLLQGVDGAEICTQIERKG